MLRRTVLKATAAAVVATSVSIPVLADDKTINFGIIYGMSAFGLSKQLDISQKMAQTYIDNYFSRYKGVKAFMDTTIEAARKTKRTSTLLGRIRPLPDISAANRTVRPGWSGWE